MAAKWTIDNLNRLLICKVGVVELMVEQDLYSDWKEEYLLGVNSSFPPAMRSIGGDPVTGTKDAGATFFMINGWRIRPDEVDHTLNIVGNLFTDPAGESVVINTLGAFNVRVEMFVSNLVDAAVAQADQALLRRLEVYLRNRQIVSQIDKKLKIFDDASALVEFESLIWQDEAGTIPYAGKGIERRDRLEPP